MAARKLENSGAICKALETWGEALRNYANDGDVFLFVMQSFVVPIWAIPSPLQLRQFFILAAYEP